MKITKSKKVICGLATLAVAFGVGGAATLGVNAAGAAPSFDGASVTLNEDITLNFSVKDYTEDYALSFTYQGEEYEGTVANGKASFSLVTPQYLDESVTAKLVKGEETIQKTYSVKEYLYTLVNAKQENYTDISCEKFVKMQTLAADVLNYGAAAQKKYLAKTEGLVNAELSATQTGTTFETLTTDDRAFSGTASDKYEWVSAGIRFDYNVSLYFIIKPTTAGETLKLKVGETVIENYATLENGSYRFRYEEVSVTDFDKAYTVNVLDENGEAIGQTLTYSVNGYVFAKQNDASMGEMAKAVYNYGVAAKAYLNAGENHLYQETFTPPTKTVYFYGEKIDTTGMSLKSKCTICGEEKETQTTPTLDKITATTLGETTITVNYGEVVKAYEVTVKEKIEIIAGNKEWKQPNGTNTSSYYLNNEGLTELGEYKTYGTYSAQFEAGAKMRFYVYREVAGDASLYFRAACGSGEKQANKCFSFKHYKLSSETQELSGLTAQAIAMSDDVKFGYSSRSDTDPDAYKIAWNDYSKECFVGNIHFKIGWNVVEVEFPKAIEVNFKSIIIKDRIEIISGSDYSDVPNDTSTSSFVLSKVDSSELGEYKTYGTYSAQFKTGAKMRFYVYRANAGRANLYFRAACGNGETQANQFFSFKIYKPTTGTQDLSELTAETVAMGNNVKFGYSSRSDTDPDAYKIAWNDYSQEILVGEINLRQGWNVVEVEFIKNLDVNFKSVIVV